MRASRLLVLDLQSSIRSATRIPLPVTLNHLSSPFRCKARRIASSRSLVPSVLRKPGDRWIKNGAEPDPGSSSSCELDLFLDMLPDRIRKELLGHSEIEELIEVVMDLGREALARFPSGDWVISQALVSPSDLNHAMSRVGDFSDDNRSGINSSLHRISAIRNRKSQVVGLTCRVGRAVAGSAEVVRDLVENGNSILVVGPPGVGKTTLIREIARMLADDEGKRVVIVDTSNEIGGDGDVPHAGIGRARRMQVPNVNMQHNVMIEAVENHMPQTIVIDEIGTELEAMAASTIAQRGVQLVGTAHGVTIENIIKNPSLQILVGGIESVTLGDEEARKRKVQKTVLERKGPPAFTCAVELISRTECRIHYRLDSAVDAFLAGKTPLFEIRKMETSHVLRRDDPEELKSKEEEDEYLYPSKVSERRSEEPVFVFTYKLSESDLSQVAKVMGVENEIEFTDDIAAADAVLVTTSELKQNSWIRGIAKFHELPVFAIKSSAMAQMVKAVRMILGMESYGEPRVPLDEYADIEVEEDAPKRKPSLEEMDALEEVRMAIEYIVIPGGEAVELLPRRSEIIARQLELVDSYQLAAEHIGTELSPRLQILPSRIDRKVPFKSPKLTNVEGYGGTSVSRLPLLPL